jgi:hypothetical protein
LASSGNIYYGLWYPVGIAAMTFILGTLFLRETKDANIATGSAQTEESITIGSLPAAVPVPVRVKA